MLFTPDPPNSISPRVLLAQSITGRLQLGYRVAFEDADTMGRPLKQNLWGWLLWICTHMHILT